MGWDGMGRNRTPRLKRLWDPISLSNGCMRQLRPESTRLKRAAVSVLSNTGFRMRAGVHTDELYDCVKLCSQGCGKSSALPRSQGSFSVGLSRPQQPNTQDNWIYCQHVHTYLSVAEKIWTKTIDVHNTTNYQKNGYWNFRSFWI